MHIKLDNKNLQTFDDFVNGEKKDIEFDVELDEGDHQLAIERTNKSTKDTVVKGSKIIKDSTIEILDLVMDRISIEPLLDKAKFFPRYPEPWLSQQKQAGKVPPTSYDYCRTLHHNGEWRLNFASPIHIWFFQNIDVQI